MKDFNLKLNVNEVNLVLKALSQLPYNQVNEIITKVHAQAQEQLTTEVIDQAKKNETVNN